MGIIPTELGLAPDIIDLDSEIVSPETYDEVALNLSGRATSDPDDDRSQNPTSNNTLRCKNKHVFSTFNARTLAPVGRIEDSCTAVSNTQRKYWPSRNIVSTTPMILISQQ